MNARHAKTLQAVLKKPTASAIVFADLEALIIGLGGEVREQAGSRVAFDLNGRRLYLHRPHPSKEAKRYQVEEVRALLASEGFKP
jgi:hypothetical protein